MNTAIESKDLDLRLDIDVAHLKMLDMSVHLLGYINSFRAISELPDYLGRRRVRYALVLIMLDEMASLMELMKECERGITEHLTEVFIEDYHSPQRRQEGVEHVLEEISKSEILFLKVKDQLGREPSSIDFDIFKGLFRRSGGNLFPLVEKTLRYDWNNGNDESDMPSEDELDMLFIAIELNVRGAAEFSYEWARANELEVDFRLETRYNKDGIDRRKEKGYWVTAALSP
ncbi:MAG: hypothetical protein MIO87_00345 [Methanomassiliicoccales archaeon]|nr:hypothetical protein [Methanomassiliicoccales archaeon]TFG57525.1 MAG: hypothetical protein E4H30_00370 [Methanomassiliicoccus sp.]